MGAPPSLEGVLVRALRTWVMLCLVWGAVSVFFAVMLVWVFWDSGTGDELRHLGFLVFAGSFFPGIPIAAVAAVVWTLARRVAVGDPGPRI